VKLALCLRHHFHPLNRTQGVDVENPSQPDLLRLPLDQISTGKHKERDDDSRKLHGVVKVWAKTADRTEEECHSKVARNDHEEEGEERSSFED
jgi:hypothetical protein